jgi:hypothetical protein
MQELKKFIEGKTLNTPEARSRLYYEFRATLKRPREWPRPRFHRVICKLRGKAP